MGAAVPPTSVVEAPLNYYREVADGGVTVTYPGTVGITRLKGNTQIVKINDIRGRESEFKLDVHGFQLVQHPSELETFTDETVKQTAYGECVDILKNTPGVTHVHPMNHKIRHQTHQSVVEIAKDLDGKKIMSASGPAMDVHVDQTYDTANMVLHAVLDPEESGRLAKTRWGIINVWRPLKPVRREPLALCDARSVLESDLRAVTQIYPGRDPNSHGKEAKAGSVQVWNVAASPNHKWYYASNMSPDEVMLIKCFDSKLDGRARRCPHTAFKSPFDEGPARESVEVRCLVFWEDQDVE